MRRWIAVALFVLGGCATDPPVSRWQEGYEDGCLHARGASPERCEARADEIEGLDAEYRAGWLEGYEACKFGPDGC